MRAKVKYAVIYRHQVQYPVLVMCRFFTVSRSGYYSYVQRMRRPEKVSGLAETIQSQQAQCFHPYGYRQMWQWLKGSKKFFHNPKTILHTSQAYFELTQQYGITPSILRRGNPYDKDLRTFYWTKWIPTSLFYIPLDLVRQETALFAYPGTKPYTNQCAV